MEATLLVDSAANTRDLVRQLRTGRSHGAQDALPESVAWQLFIELRKRGEPSAEQLFIRTLRRLHTRRSVAGVELPSVDGLPEEHRMADDAFLGELWKAYKKCICYNRTGPASQLLRDIEEQIQPKQ